MASPQIDVDEIVATLEQIRQRGHSAHTVFRDWVNLMMFALQDRDDPYLEIVDDYRERGDMDYPDEQRSVDLFAKAFGQLQERMAATDADVLGAVYEEYGMSSDAFGQHFTPHFACRRWPKSPASETRMILRTDRQFVTQPVGAVEHCWSPVESSQTPCLSGKIRTHSVPE